MGHKAAIYLSNKLKTKVEIGSLDIQFFKEITLQDVYIEDLHKDTLFYSKKLNVGIDKLDFKKHTLHLANIVLLNTNAKLLKYKKDDDYNYQFIIDALQSTDTTSTHSAPWDIKFKDITLVNSGFVYKNEHDTLNTAGVNYFDINAKSINTHISDLVFEQDTIRGTIEYLSALEKSGFIINNLSCYAKISPVLMQLDELQIKTPASTITTDLIFKYDHYRDYRDFINKVTINAAFNKSHLDMSDVAYFAPQLKGINQKLIVTGKVTGKVKDLRGKDMDILLNGNTQFTGDVLLTGLPKTEETIIYLNIKKLSTNYNDLKQIPLPPFEEHKRLNVPIDFVKLGNIKFKGTFVGLYNDFYAYGSLSTALGNLSSDIYVRNDSLKNKLFYKGKLKSEVFDFGTYFNVAKLGKATINIDIDGSGIKLGDINAKASGTINSIEFNNYSYQNIAIEGDFAKEIFKGKLNVKDDNIDLDFNGTIDFTEKLPRLDFISTINKADIAALHFINSTKKTNFTTKVFVNLTGNNIDNLNGQIHFDNTVYQQSNDIYKVAKFNLSSKELNEKKEITLNSDFLDANINGKFKILDLPVSFQRLLGNYLPAYFSKNSKDNAKKISIQNFDYNFLFKNTTAITKLFAPDIKIAPKTSLNGNFNSTTNQFVLKGNSDKLSIKGFAIKNWHINANTNGKLDFNTGCDRLYTSDSTWLTNFNIITNTHLDSVNLAITWDNKTINQYKGDIKAFINIDPNKLMQLKILPSLFVVADSVWSINTNNEVLIDSSYITVKDVSFQHSNQSFALNGIISNDKNDQIKLLLNNFNLANINLFTKSAGVNLKGSLSGESTVTDFYHGLVFTSNNSFKSVFINDNELGNGEVTSIYDYAKEALSLNGSFTLGIVPNVLFSGYYYPKKEEDNIDMKLNLEAMQMQLFEPFVKKYCSSFKGFFAGNVSIKGSVKKPLLTGKINTNAKKITVDYLNTTYNFSHDIIIDNNSFGVENMTIYDVNGNKAIATGKVYHNNFKDFQLDFDIQTNKFMCLNTTEADNSLYYGKAYATGIVNIFGFTDDINIDANVKTEKVTSYNKSDKVNFLSKTELTKFYIPLSKPSEVSESNFITFVKKDSTIKISNDYKVNLGGVTLNFDLDVTPDAEVQLIFDQKIGDILKTKGNGNLKLNITKQGDFKMYGDYVIDNGDYLFTLQNVISKKFDLENGGTIRWSGVPYHADLNLSAIYKSRTSLKPFFPDDSTGVYKKRYPVDLKLLMTGDLLAPEINFDIGLPSVDASTRQTVLSYINNDVERNRQVFSLLILNSFVTPYQLSNAGSGVPNVSSFAGTNTSELLSNQLNNMLSKISKDFDVGINYRPGDAISKEELGVALSTQLFDDKLSIDGNVGVNNNNQNTNNVIGDLNVEYKLTNDGKVRIKAFNKANDYAGSQLYGNGLYTQGVGIFYREEFDTFKELYRRYLNAIKPKKQKSLEPDVTPPEVK